MEQDARQDSKQDAHEFLTVDQAAQYLQVSQSSIRSYIRQGMLKAFRIAGKRKVLIPRTELLALLEPARSQDSKDGAKHAEIDALRGEEGGQVGAQRSGEGGGEPRAE